MSTRFRLAIAILLFSLVSPLFGQLKHAQTMEATAAIVDLSSEVEVRRGSVIRVTVSIRNTGTEATTFYVGASFESWDRYSTGNIWEDLPGWGTTPSVNPSSTTDFTFGDYQILSDEYIGEHGIYVAVWTDSTKSTKVTDRWFENVITVVSEGAEIVDLTITVVEY